MNYILIHWNFGRKSMEKVVEKMEQPCNILARKRNGTWWQYTTEMDMWTEISPYILSDIFSEDHNIINWGNHILNQDKRFKLNKPSAVERASDKKESRGILLSKGVRTPATNLLSGVFMIRPEDFPLIMRPRFHRGGKDFYLVHSHGEFEKFLHGRNWDDWYASKIFPKTHEYRVHCAHGKILMISSKPLVEGEIRANHIITEESWPAVKWSEFNPKICQESLKAVEILGLDYGAVDIMYNAHKDSVAVCEVNTSPSVSTEYSSSKYAQYFDWLIRHDFPKHFPIEGTSVFYNKILRN